MRMSNSMRAWFDLVVEAEIILAAELRAVRNTGGGSGGVG